MNKRLEALTDTLLMGPGPFSVHPEVYGGLSRPTIGHLYPRIIEVIGAIKEHLHPIFATKLS